MLDNQIINLTETANHMLTLARSTGKASEAEKFTELGLKCLAEARGILRERHRNSVQSFLEVAAFLGLRGDQYVVYLEFCARNNLEILSGEDFAAMVAEIFGQS
jgi:hypothetical protein